MVGMSLLQCTHDGCLRNSSSRPKHRDGVTAGYIRASFMISGRRYVRDFFERGGLHGLRQHQRQCRRRGFVLHVGRRLEGVLPVRARRRHGNLPNYFDDISHHSAAFRAGDHCALRGVHRQADRAQLERRTPRNQVSRSESAVGPAAVPVVHREDVEVSTYPTDHLSVQCRSSTNGSYR